MTDRPNFVFYMPETLRAESLGCYGHPLVKTPNYDRVAGEGVQFDNCYCQYPICGPSRCSMMSGLYPHNTGCRTNEFFLQPHQPSLFRYLKEAGYHVEWHGKNDLYSEDYFPLAVTRSGQNAPSLKGRPCYNVHQGRRAIAEGQPGHHSFLCEPMGTAEDFNDAHTMESAIHWLNSRTENAPPFALYLALQIPHPPYTVPEEYYNMYSPDDVPLLRPSNLPGKPALHDHLRHFLGLEELPDDTLRRINAVYLGMISYSDWVLGKLLDRLDQPDLRDNTILVILSDHGDYAGDYGLVHKAWAGMEETQTRVPFIWRGPGMAAGHRVEEPVELFDLMATTLDLAGVPCRHPHFAQSLTPQLAGGPGDPARAAFAEGGIGENMEYCLDHNYNNGQLIHDRDNFYRPQALCSREHPEIMAPTVMVRDRTHKLIFRPGTESELYDMVGDPGELVNLYGNPAHTETQRALERRILDWLVATSDTTPSIRHSRATPVLDTD